MARGWQVALTGDGSWTLRHPVHGQACHSLDGAWTESVERYARPCRLAQVGAQRAGPVRLLDIGTGLGLNIAAALAEVAECGVALEVTTCELDSDVIAHALALGPAPGRARAWHAQALQALEAALAGAGDVPLGAGGRLRLLLGDARELLPAEPREPFEAVFLDPFSHGVDAALWEEPFLREVAARMAPGALLSTYSAAFSVRLALLRAGLRVGRGPRVGRKASGTLASLQAPLEPLEGRTERRLARRR